MVETVQEFVASRGGLGVLILLHTEPMRFNELANELPISSSTLDKRLDEGRDLGLVTMKWQEGKKPHKFQNWITERGKFVVRKMEREGMVHPYQTMLDLQKQVKEGKNELQAWLNDDEVKEALARCDEDDPYVDEFGQDITGYSNDDSEVDDDVFISERAGDTSGSEPDSESGPG